MLELIWKSSVQERMDGARLIPELLLGLPLAELFSLKLDTVSGSVRLEDTFWVRVHNDHENVVCIRGVTRNLDQVGARMSTGTLVVQGDVGDRCGDGMRGGELVVCGDTGAETCRDFQDGLVSIIGNCGDRMGAPAPGKKSGIRGGDILITGNVGQRACERMRRGTVLIAGSAGDYLAPQMIAGTILVFGSVGQHWGLGMRRGSLVFATSPESEPASSLGPGRELELSFLPLVWNHLRATQRRLNGFLRNIPSLSWREIPIPATRWVERRIGDFDVGGRGEVLVLRKLTSSILPSQASSDGSHLEDAMNGGL